MAHPKPDFTIKWGTLDEPIAPIADIDQNNGWSFLGNTPPTAAQFDYWFNLVEKRTAWLEERLSELLKPGIVVPFAANSVPSGYLKCNGAAVSRTTYAGLFAVVGTTYGAGDGSTTFNLPDLRGEFVRGWDDGRGIDASRVMGSWQADEIKSHNHTASSSEAGSHSHNIPHDGNVSGDGPYGGDSASTSGGNQVPTSAAGSHSHTITVNASGGPETRPRNIAMLYCIKF